MKDLRDDIKKTKSKSKKQLDVINKILDENNVDNITLFDADNNPIEFEQIAVVPVEENLYAILIPVTPMQGVEEGEGVLFYINEQTNELEVVNDVNIIDKALDVYKKLIDEN